MVKGYSRTQISLHWAVALLIIYQLLFSDGMSEVWRAFRQTGTTTMTLAAWIHIIAGLLVLAFAGWRLYLRRARGVPPEPEGEGQMMRLAGQVGHGALYILMLAMPITGLLAWYGNFVALAPIHADILKLLLILMIALHLIAALWHQFVLKDNLLNRMRNPQD